MNKFLKTRLVPFIAFCSVCAPSSALVGGGANGQIAPITRQIEQKISRTAERAMENRVQNEAEKQAKTSVKDVRERLNELPATLPVRNSAGRIVFNDVVVEDGFRAVQNQWLVVAMEVELASLNQPGITIIERNELAGLGITTVRFQVTDELDSRTALEKALPDLADRLDRNHVYAPQSSGDAITSGAVTPPRQSLCQASFRIGMVDTAIDMAHPVFANANIVENRFLDMKEANGPLADVSGHGTAIASLMVGQQDSQWDARLPEATIYNASVFYGRNAGLSGATLSHLLQGLNWLASQELTVINVSLAGPDNRLLKTAVNALVEKGSLLVAAVGNQGPAAAPLYPAAYTDVIGVTAIDVSDTLYRWANRGEQVMFSALGVSVPVAIPGGDMALDSGTSLAAPLVTAALACERSRLPQHEAITALINSARDLGDPGRDQQFGYGVLDL